MARTTEIAANLLDSIYAASKAASERSQARARVITDDAAAQAAAAAAKPARSKSAAAPAKAGRSAAAGDALAARSDVRIPLGEFAAVVPGTALEQTILDHVRVDDPNAPTAATIVSPRAIPRSPLPAPATSMPATAGRPACPSKSWRPPSVLPACRARIITGTMSSPARRSAKVRLFCLPGGLTKTSGSAPPATPAAG